MAAKKRATKIRRTVALPSRLVGEVTALAPPSLRGNLNRLVTVALEEFAARRKALAFEQAMANMAADPAIRAESEAILREFAPAESDGIRHD